MYVCRYEQFDLKLSGPCMNRWCTTGEYGGHKRAPCRFIIALTDVNHIRMLELPMWSRPSGISEAALKVLSNEINQSDS